MEKDQTMSRVVFATLFLILIQNAVAKELTKVRIDFVEALAPRDTTSSERFQKDYEGAISLGKSLLSSKLAKCGYELDTKNTFYEASDALKAKEIAAQIDKQESWLIVGPRRSNHYLLLAQGADSTPTISLMASADEVAKLGNSHTSLSPTNSELAKVAALEAKKQKGGRASYVTVVSDDCTACVDYAKAFDRSASSLGLKKLAEIPVRGEVFEQEPIRESVLKSKPDFILLPNYSKVSARVMNIFNSSKSSPLFVGSDGWGGSALWISSARRRNRQY